MTSDQERAWAGEFGNDYNRRAPGDEEANYRLFMRIRRAMYEALMNQVPGTILELGAGQGANLRALRRLFPGADLTGLELNQQAVDVLSHTTGCKRVIHASVLDWEPDRTWDFVLTKGLLIHIHPEELRLVYEVIHRAAARWILLAEYYNPIPVEIIYRGRSEMLWKRDFAGEFLDRYNDVRLVDYGFVYRRDPYPQDDLHWFLLERVP